MDPLGCAPRCEPQPEVRVLAALSGEELLRIRCRCRHDVVVAVAARLDVWPGEQRLLLQGGELWTKPALPVELALVNLGQGAGVQGTGVQGTVQLVRVRETASIRTPEGLRLGLLTRLSEMSPNIKHDGWCRDLGEPTSEVFLHIRDRLPHVGYKGIARALLLRRRMDELLPMADYDAAAVLQQVRWDDALWAHLAGIDSQAAKLFLRSLDEKGLIDLGRYRQRVARG